MIDLGSLLSIIAEKLLPDRNEIREAEVKEKLVFLLESVTSVSNTYREFKRDENRESYQHWQDSVLSLANTLNELKTTLSVVWPDAFDAVHNFVASEIGEDQYPAREKIIRILEDSDALKTGNIEHEIKGIDNAVLKLKDAIRERLTEGEMHQAQKKFNRDYNNIAL
ncbi:MAG: hypothetical protein GY816_23980 [Cytophagales bacterium]|nr:hypothetical protein [Cytophagales bacterium]